MQVVQFDVTVVVVSTVTERVEDTCITCSKDYCAIAVSVVSVFSHLGCTLVNGNDVAEQVLSVCVQSVVENKTGQTFTVVQECKILCCALRGACRNNFFFQQGRSVAGVVVCRRTAVIRFDFRYTLSVNGVIHCKGKGTVSKRLEQSAFPGKSVAFVSGRITCKVVYACFAVERSKLVFPVIAVEVGVSFGRVKQRTACC